VPHLLRGVRENTPAHRTHTWPTENGQRVCNACGMYFRQNGVSRKTVIFKTASAHEIDNVMKTIPLLSRTIRVRTSCVNETVVADPMEPNVRPPTPPTTMAAPAAPTTVVTVANAEVCTTVASSSSVAPAAAQETRRKCVYCGSAPDAGTLIQVHVGRV